MMSYTIMEFNTKTKKWKTIGSSDARTSSDAKRYFSKNSRPKLGDDYLRGSAIRQEYLQTAIDWISGSNIEDYMSKHQHDKDAKNCGNIFRKS